ncbi:MAG: hypothetical protein JEZ03_05915 [Bacteroidales bacterium]|nr:hypothetical protein [Bacteroidales bacterium]
MEDYMFSIRYEFDSGLGPMEGSRYIREFKVGVYADNYEKPEKLIGKAAFKVVYIDEALDTGYSLYEIFDTYEYTFRHGQDFFDFETGQIKEDIQKYYHYDIMPGNICLLERIEILPEFRGQKLAAKVTKDIIFHFRSGCSLFIIQAYPLQFEAGSNDKNDWRYQQELDRFPSNENEAFKQLINYYKSFGFEQIKGYNELLFYNPALRNKKMEAINLEE